MDDDHETESSVFDMEVEDWDIDENSDIHQPVEEVPVERVEVWSGIGDTGGVDFTDEDERLTACEQSLGYGFHDRRLLARALTHSSSTSDKSLDNERMEFFGDAVLDLVVREFLFHNYPNRQEGDLTEAKSTIVCRGSLAHAAKSIHLKRYLILGRGMGRKKKIPDSLLADAYEAVVAAIYIDGGYPPAKKFIMETLGSEMPLAIERANVTNFKSNLQKLTQQCRHALPQYRVLGSSGPEHSRIFEIAVSIEGQEMGRGSGSSKKAAEQEAAKQALDNIARDENNESSETTEDTVN